jgi:hypothetical protein
MPPVFALKLRSRSEWPQPRSLQPHVLPAISVSGAPSARVPGAAFEVLHQGVQTAETNKLLCAQVLQAGPPVIGFDAVAPKPQDQERLFVHAMRVLRPP